MELQKEILINQLEQDMHIANSSQKINIKNNISKKHRLILVNWIFNVCEEHNIQTNILQESIILMDNYFQVKKVETQKYQLLALTCLYLQLKMDSQVTYIQSELGQGYYQEISFDWCVIKTDFQYTKDDFKHMEFDIMDTLQGKLKIISPINLITNFLSLFLTNFKSDIIQVETISSICLQNYDQIQNMNARVITFSTLIFYFLKFQSQHLQEIQQFLSEYEKYVNKDDIANCIQYLHQQWNQTDLQDTLDQFLSKKSVENSPAPSQETSSQNIQHQQFYNQEQYYTIYYQQQYTIQQPEQYTTVTARKCSQNTLNDNICTVQKQYQAQQNIIVVTDEKSKITQKSKISEFDENYNEEGSNQENDSESNSEEQINFDRFIHLRKEGQSIIPQIPDIINKTISKETNKPKAKKSVATNKCPKQQQTKQSQRIQSKLNQMSVTNQVYEIY